MNLVKKWTSVSLIVRIVIFMAIGALLGVFAPSFKALTILGSLFVGLLKAIAPMLVFILVMSSLANSGKGLGKRFRTVLILYMASTIIAAMFAVVTSTLFPVTMSLSIDAAEGNAPSSIVQVLENLLTSMVSNPVAALMNGSYIAILFWAVVFGLLLKKVGSDATKSVVSDFADVVSGAVGGIIQLAPLGILGLVFDAVSTSGMEIFVSYGKLVLLLVGTMAFVALVINPLIVFLCLKRNPYPLVLKCLKQSGITAFFTRSSAANIPVNMKLCEELGLERDFYSVCIPLGSTINMDGAAVVITIMSLAAANTVGIEISLGTKLVLCLISTLAACGTSGVAGGSLLLIPMACSLLGVDGGTAMQAVAVGFIISVIQDSVETALNSSSDVIFAATAEYYDRKKEGKEMHFLGK